MIELLCQLLDPLLTVIYHHRSKRKLRWEQLFVPLHKELTVIHHQYIAILEAGIDRVTALRIAQQRNGKSLDISLQRIRHVQYYQHLHRARKSSSKDTLSIGHVQSYMAICQSLSRRGRLTAQEEAYTKTVLHYLPALKHPSLKLNILTMSSQQHVGADALLMELEEALDYHVLLFQYLCELYSQLQTGLLE